MAWITPVTDRQTGLSRMTYDDMNRITGNINYVYDLVASLGKTITGGKVSQTVWTQDDILTTTFWASMLDVLSNVCAAAEYTPAVTPTGAMEYQNINNIETITLYLYNYARADYLLTHTGVEITTETGENILATI